MSSDVEPSGAFRSDAWLSKGLFVSGLVYPVWFALTPAGAIDSQLGWLAVGAVQLAPESLQRLRPQLKAHRTWLCTAALAVLTAHLFVLANLNDMHPFYAVGSVAMAVNCSLTFSHAPAFLAFACYVLVLIGVTTFASAWEPVYYGPLAIALMLAYWHLNHRNRAEAQLARYRDDLERLVEARTRELRQRTEDLAEANQRLSQEMADRERAEASLHVWQRLQSVARLAGGVAHDFNNLLTTITVYAEMLRDSLPLHSTQRSDAQEICDAAERATALTRQLLTFSRGNGIESTSLDLNRVLRESETIVRAVSGEDVDVVFDLCPDSAGVHAHRGQLEQVVANLTANARDAMPHGGRLTFETRVLALDEILPGELPSSWSADPITCLRVRDTGLGMDDDTLQRVFDPFFTTKDVGKGTGLGLAAVHGIVQESRGWIRVESSRGFGTCFSLYWPTEPVSAQSAAEVHADAMVAIAPRVPSRRILVVDDEPSLRALVVRILRGDGFEVESVPDADAALAALRDRERPIDLMVTDIVLPRKNGIDLWRDAARLRPGLRVLFISGHLHHPSLSSRTLPAGAPLLPKPFSGESLVDEVRAALCAPTIKPAYN